VSPELGTEDLELFRNAVERRLGLHFDEQRATFLAEVLMRRAQSRKLSAAAYVAALMTELEASDELSTLARELTIGESYFFRHSDQFTALRDQVLPERLSARAASRQLRLLSAGCSSGEEAYSLAMTLGEAVAATGFSLIVQGVDLNPDALAKARSGSYTAWSLRETPEFAKRRWFTQAGREFRTKPELSALVRFEQHNLMRDSPELLAPGTFDVIFCRNVLMYFGAERAKEVVERLTRALAPGGFLFLGHAETLRGISQRFQLRHSHEAFYYQERSAPRLWSEPPVMSPPAKVPQTPVPGTGSEWVGPWLTTVERSSERIRVLSQSQGGSVELQAAAPSPVSAPSLKEPLELLQHERFAEALALLSELSYAAHEDPAALLLRATLLTHLDDLGEAERACHELLRLDDLNAGAHYLLALCCERRQRAEMAALHDRTAAYLDTAFAMPHLHLGLMARRRREVAQARRELSLALTLLESEDAWRLVLFGGGFSREALLSLCRSELVNLKGAP